MRRLAAALLALAALMTVAACGDGGDDGDQVEQRTLTVFAAASLTSTFTELAQRFEAEHDGVEVRLSFGGSSDLAAQIAEGAPADVFASADEQTMARVSGASETALAPEVFATNTLQIATPAGSERVRELADLADPAVKVVVCAPQVPCGAATRTLLAKNALDVDPVSEEQSVTDVLGKVTSGEADAAIVYRTDVIGAGDTVRGVEAARADEVVSRYPVVALDDDNELADEFVRFVTGESGREVLSAAGFGAP
ncbi:MAG: molybdate ABC transporter substrate-binding protein [Aeromicrobium sp.]